MTDPQPEVYLSENYIVLDFETTNKRFGTALEQSNKLVLAVYGQLHKYTVCSGGEMSQQGLVRAISDADFIVCHNAKFELGWLKRCGLDLHDVLVYDTLIGEYVLYGNIRKPFNLGETAKRYGYKGKEPYIDMAIKGGVCPSELPTSLLKERCVYDVRTTEAIFRKQRLLLQQQGKLGVQYTRCIATPCLADIEFNGMCLDKEKVLDEYTTVTRELTATNTEFRFISEGINPRSNKQLQEFLYDRLGFTELSARGVPNRTPSGARKCDLSTISNLVARTKEQRQVKKILLKQSKLNAALTKNLEFFKEICDGYGGIFQGQFNQTATRTHRLSSSGLPIKIRGGGRERGVQFQNLPRQYKSLFTHRREGYRVVEIDGSQLEFRVAAHLGRDAQAIRDIITGEDVHQNTADILTKSGQKTNRQAAKAHTFKPLYGGQSGTQAEKEYYRWFKRRYSGVAQAQEKWKQEVLRTGSLVTETGLVFTWSDTKMNTGGYITNSTSICNYPVQSLATADIIPLALTYLWHRLYANGMESFIVNTIHDSVVAEVKDDEEELYKALAVQSFTETPYAYLKKVYNIDFMAPLGCGYKAGTHWGVGTEEKFETKRSF